ncbi:DinB family protein [Streptomyces luteolus]|uniref:DinB family protein n=1 Tax=Streptomyces luteolus TaxID=3043615 RepID=A0ABT6SYE5_9ACTN|nr:DinB family protein [Streptomyces sp. B-S-A12]MDI3420630.1 DinB family protein [Streptomyces sp. B-S-A12]
MTLRVPPTGGEKESLLASLEQHRDVVLWKVRGLDEEQLRRPLTPTGTSLLTLVKHLACVEYGWLCTTFDRPTEPLPDAYGGEDLRIMPGETAEDVIAFYGRARAAANSTVEELELDALGTSWPGEPVSLRWALIHMIEETARHTGHMDIVRELIDGAVGDHPED